MAKKLLVGLMLLLVLVSAGFVAWGATPAGPGADALAALVSDGAVQVAQEPWLAFSPVGQTPQIGLVLYPGGRVDARSYAPLARQIAAQGVLVVIVPMPLSLAVFDAGAAQDVMAAYPAVSTWAVGGHSLGGAMAARFAYQHPGAAQRLVLWAAYPAESDDLSAQPLAVLSISAALDGLTTPDKIAASRALLPANTQWLAIAGGNHAGFGDYGAQNGDKPSTLAAGEQWAQVARATADFLRGLGR